MKYYGLFDILRRNNCNTSFLRNFLSGPTITKINKGENITTDIIEKICYVLHCQPGDIMEMTDDDFENINNASDKATKARELFLDIRKE